MGRTLKYRTSNLPNLQKSNLEPTEPLICSLKSNLEPTEPPKNRTEPRTLLNRMRKNWWFFEFFLSKPNLEPTEPLVGPQKPNLEPTEPQKTERTSEPNQVRPNTTKNVLVTLVRFEPGTPDWQAKVLTNRPKISRYYLVNKLLYLCSTQKRVRFLFQHIPLWNLICILYNFFEFQASGGQQAKNSVWIHLDWNFCNRYLI